MFNFGAIIICIYMYIHIHTHIYIYNGTHTHTHTNYIHESYKGYKACPNFHFQSPFLLPVGMNLYTRLGMCVLLILNKGCVHLHL